MADAHELNLVGVWSPRGGYFYLTLNGRHVPEESSDEMAYFSLQSECERYAKRRFGVQVTRWRCE